MLISLSGTGPRISFIHLVVTNKGTWVGLKRGGAYELSLPETGGVIKQHLEDLWQSGYLSQDTILCKRIRIGVSGWNLHKFNLFKISSMNGIEDFYWLYSDLTQCRVQSVLYGLQREGTAPGWVPPPPTPSPQGDYEPTKIRVNFCGIQTAKYQIYLKNYSENPRLRTWF